MLETLVSVLVTLSLVGLILFITSEEKEENIEDMINKEINSCKKCGCVRKKEIKDEGFWLLIRCLTCNDITKIHLRNKKL